ncbi:unnamed protein product [Rhizopus microsporus]|uniref:UPF0052-domain-containing protein n=1 Tax=Rhizopus microsporus TaxID=58291 RepID=A0A0A1NJY6_RHIZD|nr:UPF0052-domain-containing protein [Rhizopus microsporus]CEI92083.1 hypothetical protein RMCBS344292_06356 [Rhizopus microsporus]
MTSSFVVFSGGSACNHILKAFHNNANDDQVSYILGISDNGGSTSEILRVLGGPSVGDLRSRLLKLIDIFHNNQDQEMIAIKNLLSYRLPMNGKDEWSLITEGRHKIWNNISVEKKEAIRGFLTLFDFEILKRAHKRFNFCNGSIGNFFLSGARIFTGSLEAAIFLFASIIGVPNNLVIPVINTNQTATIAATLVNGQTLIGQCEISHPPLTTNSATMKRKMNPIDIFTSLEQESFIIHQHEKDESSNLFFSKQVNEKLDSPIQRIYYINEYGQEIFPVPSSKVISQLSNKETLIYSIGSLYTSLIPSLVLRNIGNAIAQSQSLKYKIVLLNGSNDRETCDYTALDFIYAITNALNESQRIDARRAFYDHPEHYNSSNNNSTDASTVNSICTPPSSYPPFPDHLFYPSSISTFITHMIYLDNTTIHVDVEAIERLGIRCIPIKGSLSDTGEPIYLESALSETIHQLVM